MAYDEGLAQRIRDELEGTTGLTEKKMFGGIGWMIHGNMAAGAHNDMRMMIRCSKEDHPDFVAEPGAGGMIQGGREMRGWILIDAEAVADDDDFRRWLERGKAFAQSLPPKPPKKK